MKIIIQLILMGAAVTMSAYIIPGVEVASFWWAIVVGVVIALLNSTVGWILRFLTLPINWLTLGLVSGIITVLMILLSSNLIDGFNAGGFWNAVFFAIVLALISALFASVQDD